VVIQAEQRWVATLYYAALQSLSDGVKVRLGSIGGLLSGPKSYEKAYFVTLRDLGAHGVELEDGDRRGAFQFGVLLADAERVLAQRS
jgi:hypothetical protein